jgi:hypothetical protein
LGGWIGLIVKRPLNLIDPSENLHYFLREIFPVILGRQMGGSTAGLLLYCTNVSLNVSNVFSCDGSVKMITSVTLSTILVNSISIKHVSTIKPPLLYTLITA